MKITWVRSTAARRALRGVVLGGVLTVFARPSVISAHEVWLEADGTGTKLYFGEFADSLHEVSPGYLDKLVRPTATVISPKGEKPLEAKRLRDAIAFAGQATNAESIIAVDLAYPLMEGKDGEKPLRTAWTPAARHVPELRAHAPKLSLDVVPTNGSGQFQVTFRGAPLANADVKLVAESGWGLEGTTDDKGKVSFRLPWKSNYLLLVRHKDATPGKRQSAQGLEEAFDAASFATTLTFATSSGLPSPSRPPPAAPNKPK